MGTVKDATRERPVGLGGIPGFERSDDAEMRERAEAMLDDPLLERFSLSERRAILCHHFYVNFNSPGEADLEASVRDWESGPCKAWRHEKMRHDRREQMARIRTYRAAQRARGREIDAETAAREWIGKHAAAWREWWERQPDSTPLFFPYFFFNFVSFDSPRPSR